MSRRIVQLSAAAAFVYEPGAGVSFSSELYALDNNGIAWRLDVSGSATGKWQRLPELPSFENRTAAAPPAPTSIDLERDT